MCVETYWFCILCAALVVLPLMYPFKQAIGFLFSSHIRKHTVEMVVTIVIVLVAVVNWYVAVSVHQFEIPFFESQF